MQQFLYFLSVDVPSSGTYFNIKWFEFKCENNHFGLALEGKQIMFFSGKSIPFDVFNFANGNILHFFLKALLTPTYIFFLNG